MNEREIKEFIEREEKFIEYEWRHYNALAILFIFLLTIYLVITGLLQEFLLGLGSYGYLGGFVSGMLFTYGITTPLAMVAFFILAESLDIWLLTFLGSVGGVITEYTIYSFAKNEVGKTIKIYKNKKIRFPEIKSKFLHKISPLIAGIIIASPIPDELVAILFAVEKYEIKKFLILTFIFKFIGIFLIVGLGRIF